MSGRGGCFLVFFSGFHICLFDGTQMGRNGRKKKKKKTQETVNRKRGAMRGESWQENGLRSKQEEERPRHKDETETAPSTVMQNVLLLAFATYQQAFYSWNEQCQICIQSLHSIKTNFFFFCLLQLS